MKAFVLPNAHATAVERAEVPVPRIDDDELLVRVHAVGVGVHDSTFLSHDAEFPYPIGIEAAGVIESVGASVAAYQPGDRIAFISAMQPKGGTWAEFAAVDSESLIIALPETLDFVTAAAVPVAGNTVLRAFSALQPPTASPATATLFIAGGSGAIGTIAIQLARGRGWRVGASASPANHEYMSSLGAEMVVDYHDPHWVERVLEWVPGGVDAALAVQPGTTASTLPVVADGGQLITVSGDAVDTERGLRVEVIPYAVDVRAELVQLMADVAARRIHVELQRVYPFEDALAALAGSQTRRARGKRVIQVV